MIISDEDLNAFAAIHDKMMEEGIPFRLTCYQGQYRVELKVAHNQEISAEATSLRSLVTELSKKLIAAAGKGIYS